MVAEEVTRSKSGKGALFNDAMIVKFVKFDDFCAGGDDLVTCLCGAVGVL